MRNIKRTIKSICDTIDKLKSEIDILKTIIEDAQTTCIICRQKADIPIYTQIRLNEAKSNPVAVCSTECLKKLQDKLENNEKKLTLDVI